MDIKGVTIIYKKYVEPFLAVFIVIGIIYAADTPLGNNSENKPIIRNIVVPIKLTTLSNVTVWESKRSKLNLCLGKK